MNKYKNIENVTGITCNACHSQISKNDLSLRSHNLPWDFITKMKLDKLKKTSKMYFEKKSPSKTLWYQFSPIYPPAPAPAPGNEFG